MGRPKKNSSAASQHTAKKAVSLPGFLDMVTETDILWDAVTKRLAKISRVYGFNRVETPFLEEKRLYENFYQNDPQKLSTLLTMEMDGEEVSIRPSFLPSVLRLYYQHKIFESSFMSKWAYVGAVARKNAVTMEAESDYEFGFEVLGTFNHLTEAQVIGAVWDFLQSLGLKDLSLEINNIGKEDCQEVYQGTLQDFLSGKKYELCDACNEHLKTRPLNVLRCANRDCQASVVEAPAILDFLDDESRKHFTNILEALDELSIPYQLTPLYAGADGHSKTNFVIKYKLKGETKILGEGGYHDGLMQNLCGKNYCCFGFTASLTKVYQQLAAAKVIIEKENTNDVFLVPLGELASKKSLRLFRDLTSQKISVHDHFGVAGVKNQLKQAELFKAPIALILGQKEAMEEMVILRDVKSGMQEIISYDKIVEEVKKRLGR